MDTFTQALAALEADYLPHIEAAREELARLEAALKARTHELAVEHGYTNAVIEALKAGQAVFVHHYHDGTDFYLSVGGAETDIYSDGYKYVTSANDGLAADLIAAIEYGLIVEGEMDKQRNTPFTLTPPYPL